MTIDFFIFWHPCAVVHTFKIKIVGAATHEQNHLRLWHLSQNIWATTFEIVTFEPNYLRLLTFEPKHLSSDIWAPSILPILFIRNRLDRPHFRNPHDLYDIFCLECYSYFFKLVKNSVFIAGREDTWAPTFELRFFKFKIHKNFI